MTERGAPSFAISYPTLQRHLQAPPTRVVTLDGEWFTPHRAPDVAAAEAYAVCSPHARILWWLSMEAATDRVPASGYRGAVLPHTMGQIAGIVRGWTLGEVPFRRLVYTLLFAPNAAQDPLSLTFMPAIVRAAIRDHELTPRAFARAIAGLATSRPDELVIETIDTDNIVAALLGDDGRRADPDVTGQAIIALCWQRDRSWDETLIQVVADADGDDWVRCLRALSDGERDDLLVRVLDRSPEYEQRPVLEAMDPELACEVMAGWLGDDDTNRRTSAARLIPQVLRLHPGMAERAASVLSHPVWQNRVTAATTLASLGAVATAADSLRARLAIEVEPRVIDAIRRALDLLRPPDPVPGLPGEIV